ncbi:MAG TPA: V4R domain-containing protein [Gemmatimonadales bacterium]|jgi:predicted hydrocarbon binding protein|nr:V4R domain-containing protein [Gemmatimonadales bacterium]
MSAPALPSFATDGLTVGRAALHQLHASLWRDAADHAVTILQEAGFAAGEGVFQSFRAWLPGQTGVAEPEELDAAQLDEVLSAFFQAAGWGALTVAPLGDAALVVDSGDWAEAEPGSAQEPMCFFSAGMLSDFLGRLSGEPVAVMEVECRSRNDARCRFLSASPTTLNAIYEQMTQGKSYEEALAGS